MRMQKNAVPETVGWLCGVCVSAFNLFPYWLKRSTDEYLWVASQTKADACESRSLIW